jgi:transcriptional regulator with XRE-family HTH domain
MRNSTLSQNLLSENLKRFRSNLKMSQMKLAEQCNLSTNFISDLENGKVWVSAETLDKLCSVLGIDLYRLFLARDLPEIHVDERITSCCVDLESATRKAIGEVLEKHLKRLSDAR